MFEIVVAVSVAAIIAIVVIVVIVKTSSLGDRKSDCTCYRLSRQSRARGSHCLTCHKKGRCQCNRNGGPTGVIKEHQRNES